MSWMKRAKSLDHEDAVQREWLAIPSLSANKDQYNVVLEKAQTDNRYVVSARITHAMLGQSAYRCFWSVDSESVANKIYSTIQKVFNKVRGQILKEDSITMNCYILLRRELNEVYPEYRDPTWNDQTAVFLKPDVWLPYAHSDPRYTIGFMKGYYKAYHPEAVPDDYEYEIAPKQYSDVAETKSKGTGRNKQYNIIRNTRTP